MPTKGQTSEYERGYAAAERQVIRYLRRLANTAETRPVAAVITDRSSTTLWLAADDIINGFHLTLM